MQRLRFNGALACLVLSVLFGAAWVRSQFRADLVGYGRAKGGARMWAAGVTWGAGGCAVLHATDMPYWTAVDGSFARSEKPAGYAGDLQRLTWAGSRPQAMNPRWEAAGFIFVRINDSRRGWVAAAPLWFPFLLSAAYPAWHYRDRLTPLRRRRKRLGLCLRCGYDLRASSGRCPECGTPFPDVPTAAASAT